MSWLIADSGLGTNRRATVTPRHFLLENRAQSQKRRFIAEAADELDSDRQSVGRPMEWQRYRRLSGNVERVHEGGIGPLAIVPVDVRLRHAEMAKGPRRICQRRGDEHVI